MCKPFKSRVIEQGWCKKYGGSINNIFYSKKAKWSVLKVDDSLGNELGKDGKGCCRVKNECEWSGDR